MKKVKHTPNWVKPTKESSTIKAYAHDVRTNTLYIKFHSGGEYSYANVDEALFISMINALSLGSFFAKEIKAVPAAFPSIKLN